MKKLKYIQLLITCIGFLVISTSVFAKDKHLIDPRLVGKWMWTKASDGGYYSQSGVYSGAAYGFAIQYTVNADGSGSCFKHVQSTLGVGSGLVVDISYQGFFEMDDQGHMGFFPTSGTYKSSSGTNRVLRPDELWNTQTNKGMNYLYNKVEFTTQGGRPCYHTTSSDGKVDTFFKM